MSPYTRITIGLGMVVIPTVYAHLPANDPHSQALGFLARRKGMDVPLIGMTTKCRRDDVPTDIEKFILEMLRRLVEGADAKLQNLQVLRSILPVQHSTAQYNTDPQRRVLTPKAQAAQYLTAE